jgi:hypothetical protein
MNRSLGCVPGFVSIRAGVDPVALKNRKEDFEIGLLQRFFEANETTII